MAVRSRQILHLRPSQLNQNYLYFLSSKIGTLLGVTGLLLFLSACEPQGEAITDEASPDASASASESATSSLPPTQLAASALTTSVQAGVCAGPIKLVTSDTNGKKAKLTSDVTVVTSATFGALYTDSNCSTSASSFALAAGISEVELYFRSTIAAASVTLDFSIGGAALTAVTLGLQVKPGSTSVLSLSSAVTSGRTGQCVGPLRVGAYDEFGNPTPVAEARTVSLGGQSNGAYYSDDACSRISTGVSFAVGDQLKSVYFKGSAAGTRTLIASGTGLTSGSLALPLTASRIAVTGSSSGTSGVCSAAYTAKLTDEDGTDQAASKATTLLLTQTRSLAFYLDSACSQTITSLALGVGTGSGQFYVKDASAESVGILVSDQEGVLSSAIKSVDIASATVTPTKQFVLTGMTQGTTSTCSSSPITLTVQNIDGSATTVTQSTPVQVARPTGTFSFYAAADTSCASALTVTSGKVTLTIGSGGSQVLFYVQDTTAESVALLASDPANVITSGSKAIQFIDGASALGLASGTSSTSAGGCITMTVSSKNSAGAPSAVTSLKTLTLSGLGSAAIYSDGACTTLLSPLTLAASSSSKTFYLRDATAETLTITVSDVASSLTASALTVIFTQVPSTLTKVQGNPGSGYAYGSPNVAPKVQLLDTGGGAVAGATIQWTPGAASGTVVAASTTTDASGYSSPSWTFGSTIGSQTLVASVSGSTLTTTFTATTTSAPVSSLAKATATDAQTGTRGAALSSALQLTVVDAVSRPVSGQTITWTVASGSATFASTGTTGASSVSDGSGLASISLVLGNTPGSVAVSAGIAGSLVTPLMFTATAVNPSPSSITVISGNNQSGTVGTTAATPLRVRVLDASSNPIVAATVTWAVTSGSASLSASTSLTDTNGDAVVNLTYGGTVSASIGVSATVSGLSAATFSASSVAGAPSILIAYSGNNQTAAASAAITNPLVAKVTDAYGNLVAGATVNWSVMSGGGTLGHLTADTSDASGLVSNTWTLGASLSTQRIQAVEASSGASVVFSGIVDGCSGVAGGLTTLSIGSGSSSDPYILCTAGQLATLMATSSYWSGFFKLGQDIDATGITVARIGTSSVPFRGTLDGNNHQIVNVPRLTGSANYQGFFGFVQGATIKDLTLLTTGVSATGYDYVGGLVGYTDGGTYSNVTLSLTNSVLGAQYTGGMIGYSSANNLSVNTARVVGNTTVSGTYNVGGFIGYMNTRATIQKARASVQVSASTSGNSRVGGFVGDLFGGLITQSYSTGTVLGTTYVGGFVGVSDAGTISDSYTTSIVSATNSTSVGGFCGWQAGTITRVYSSGLVTLTGTSTHGGGYVGTGGDSNTNTKGFWDMQATSRTSGGNVSLAVGKSTSQMQNPLTFIGTEWDYQTVWTQDSGDYPKLRWDTTVTPVTTASLFASGSGTASDPYVIATPAQFANIARATALSSAARSAVYQLSSGLGSPLDFTGVTVTRIGNSSWAFTGTLDGNGKSLTNLSLTADSSASKFGVFGSIQNATLTNLGFSITSLTNSFGASYVGGLVGYALSSTVSSITATVGNVTTSSTNSPYGTGGLIGHCGGCTISSITQTLTGTVSGFNSVGGMIGVLATSDLSGSSTLGNTVTDINIIKSESGAVSGSTRVGGLIGYSGFGLTTSNSVTRCSNQGVGVSATNTSNSYLGGVIGFLRGDGGGSGTSNTFSQCFNTGTVTGYVQTGGFAGAIYTATVSDSYSTGRVVSSGNNTHTGGFVGDTYAATISRSYVAPLGPGAGSSQGISITTATNAGGFVGVSNGTYTGSFWDTTTASPVLYSPANTPAGASGILARTTAQMQDIGNYTAAGWDFGTVWGMPAGGGYPVLRAYGQAESVPTLSSLLPSGAGTSISPYLIGSTSTFKNIATAMSLYSSARSAYYTITDDLDFSGINPPMIGTSAVPFTGVVDGLYNGVVHSITNLSIAIPRSYGGLFGYLQGGTVKNLNLGINTVNNSGSYSFVGGLVGYGLSSTVMSITATVGNVTTATGNGPHGTGGLIGHCGGCVISSITQTLTGTVSGYNAVGGMIGILSALEFSGSSTLGNTVTDINIIKSGSGAVSGYTRVGGLVGHSGYGLTASNSVTRCSNQGVGVSATNTSNSFSGGVVGILRGDSGASGTSNTFSQCFNTGTVTGYVQTGGFAGYINSASVSDSYSTGRVVISGNNSNTGGFVGDTYAATISRSYVAPLGPGAGSSQGISITTATNAGGFVGVSNGTYTGSFWDTTTASPVLYSPANTPAGASGILARTTAQMQDIGNYTAAGWDFSTVWGVPAGGGYPVLRAYGQAESVPTLSSLLPSGAGTSSSPYLISNATLFKNIATAMSLYSSARSAYYTITDDLDFNGINPPMIGTSAVPFTGVVDGFYNGVVHSITNLSIAIPKSYGGLFGYLQGATVKNLNLGINTVNNSGSYSFVGGLVGYGLSSTVMSITATVGNVTTATGSTPYGTGGLIGHCGGCTISSITQTLTGTVSGYNAVGGMIGILSALEFSGSSTLGNTVTDINIIKSGSGAVSGYTRVGGLVGHSGHGLTASNSVTRCSNQGVGVSATNTSNSFLGGVVGSLRGDSGASGTSNTFSQCFNTGTVTGYVQTGGFAGGIYTATVSDSYSTGRVVSSGNNTHTGGFVGDTYAATISRSYVAPLGPGAGSSQGISITTATNAGGFVGVSSGTYSGNFWNSTTASPVLYSPANTPAGVSGIAALNSTQMQTMAPWANHGFDFYNVWAMPASSATNNGFPILRWTTGSSLPTLSSLFGGGTGTSSDPFILSTATHVRNLNRAMYAGSAGQTAHYFLANDVDLENDVYIIGTSSYPFNGNFNGNNKTLSNISISVANGNYVGLFGKIESTSTTALSVQTKVYDLNITLGTIGIFAPNSYYVGGLTGYLQASSTSTTALENVHITGTGGISGYQYVGGAIGYSYNYPTVTRAHSAIPVTGSGPSSQSYVGGFVGKMDNYVSISQSYSSGAVTGLVFVGGFVGHITNYSLVTNAYASGSVTSTASTNYLGGFASIGDGNYTASNLYASGAITGTTSTNVGGLFGYGVACTNCYWDTQTTGKATSSGGGTGKTTAEMKTATTMSAWPGAPIWNLSDGSYPALY